MKLKWWVSVAALCSVACNKAAPEPSETETKTSSPEPSAATPSRPTSAPEPTAQGLPPPPDLLKPPADAERTPSGLVTKVLTKGEGTVKPKPDDSVRVHYTGWSKDGKMFDSSLTRKSPATFRVKQVIPGWTEALQLMVAGEKRRVWIPASLAYGEKAHGGAPSGDLVFDVEVIEVMPAPEPPPVPEDVKAPPKTAKKTASGLAYRVLTPGTGKDKPSATSNVVVHYTGWTTDGKMFDSSVTRGQPATFRLDQVIKGWTEGVQLMTVGQKTRFWIPGPLAYGDKPMRPGAPAGMLVFDVELLDIKSMPPRPPM